MRVVYSKFYGVVIILQTTRGLYLSICYLHALVLGGLVTFEGVEAPHLSFAVLFSAVLSFVDFERYVFDPGLRNLFSVLYLQLLVASPSLDLAIPEFLASFAVPELCLVAAAEVLVLAVVAAGLLGLSAAISEVLVFSAVAPGLLVFAVVPGLHSVAAPEVRVAVFDEPVGAPGRLDAVTVELAVVLDRCVVAPDTSAAVHDEGFVEAPDVSVAAPGGLALVAHDCILVVAPDYYVWANDAHDILAVELAENVVVDALRAEYRYSCLGVCHSHSPAHV